MYGTIKTHWLNRNIPNDYDVRPKYLVILELPVVANRLNQVFIITTN